MSECKHEKRIEVGKIERDDGRMLYILACEKCERVGVFEEAEGYSVEYGKTVDGGGVCCFKPGELFEGERTRQMFEKEKAFGVAMDCKPGDARTWRRGATTDLYDVRVYGLPDYPVAKRFGTIRLEPTPKRWWQFWK